MTMETKRRKAHYKLIYFTEDDFGDIDREYNNPMVISALIHNFLVKRILVDQGSSTDILYSHAAEALGLQKSMYNAYADALVGFTEGKPMWTVQLDYS